jgi:hypothetical protein
MVALQLWSWLDVVTITVSIVYLHWSLLAHLSRTALTIDIYNDDAHYIFFTFIMLYWFNIFLDTYAFLDWLLCIEHWRCTHLRITNSFILSRYRQVVAISYILLFSFEALTLTISYRHIVPQNTHHIAAHFPSLLNATLNTMYYFSYYFIDLLILDWLV